jgi:hypothetical protein
MPKGGVSNEPPKKELNRQGASHNLTKVGGDDLPASSVQRAGVFGEILDDASDHATPYPLTSSVDWTPIPISMMMSDATAASTIILT